MSSKTKTFREAGRFRNNFKNIEGLPECNTGSPEGNLEGPSLSLAGGLEDRRIDSVEGDGVACGERTREDLKESQAALSCPNI